MTADGTQLIVNKKGKTEVEFYDLKTRKLLRTITTNHTGGHVAISPDGRFLVSGGQSAEFQVWDLKDNSLLNDRFVGHSDRVHSIQFSSDGKRVMTGSEDGTVRLWNAESGKQLSRFSHDASVNDALLIDDQNVIVSSSYDDTIRVWDIQTDQERLKLKGHGNTGVRGVLEYDHRTNEILSFGGDRVLRSYQLTNGKSVAEIPIPFANEAPKGNGLRRRYIYRPRINSAAGFLLAAIETNLYIFNLKTGKQTEIHEFDRTSFVYRLLPETKQLLTVEPENVFRQPGTGRITIRDLESKEIEREVEIPAYAYKIAFSPDNSLLAISMGYQKENDRHWWVSIRSVDSLEEVARVERIPGQVMAMAFSHDNRRLATSQFYESNVILWNLEHFRIDK